ncbi:MAG: hypothetical protein HQM09_24440 [Candidatus Riflebacteria bacterium]|nr:hypothetical protein [Candidatus Riflebacteria bacterium]
MKITNRLGLPQALVDAVSNDPYSDGGKCDISVTRLISPPRKVVLEKLHAKEITEDVSDKLFCLLGQAVHVILERAEVEAITEGRLSIVRQGWVISGQFDKLSLTDGVLTDYKVTSTYAAKDGGRFEYECQLNVLCGIIREHGYQVKKLEVVAILRDWSKNIAARGGDYPRAQAMKIEIPMWSEERVEEFIDERIRLHQAARVKLPECSHQERWSKPPQWALIKEGRKTAVKIFDDETLAYATLETVDNKHAIESRPGKNIRCDGYCPAAPFCDQHRRSQEQEVAA